MTSTAKKPAAKKSGAAVKNAASKARTATAAKKASAARTVVKKAVDPKAAAAKKSAVALIVKLRKAGNGYPTIAKTLNEKGIPTLGGGSEWHVPVVRSICIREFGGVKESMKVAGTKRNVRKAA